MNLGLTANSLAIWLLVSLTGCSTALLEHHELDDVEKQDTVHVAQVMEQLHLAVAAISHYYNAAAGQSVTLAGAQVNLSTTHINTEDGRVALILPMAGIEENDDASSSFELHLAPLDATQSANVFQGAQRDRLHALLDAYRDEAGSRRCAQPPAEPVDTGDDTRQLWETMTHMAISAVDGYLCTLEHTGTTASNLQSFTLKIAIGTGRSDTEGLGLAIGTILSRDSATEQNDRQSSLQLTFKP